MAQRKCTITIPPGRVNVDLTDFEALLVAANFPAEIFSIARTDGGDLRFFDIAGNPIAADVVSWNTAAQTCEVNVLVPLITASSPTTLTVRYGVSSRALPAPTDAIGRYNAYRSTADLVAPYNEPHTDPSPPYKDRTSHQRHGFRGGNVTTASGKIGKAAHAPVNTWLAYGNGGQYGKTTPFSAGAWIYSAPGQFPLFSRMSPGPGFTGWDVYQFANGSLRVHLIANFGSSNFVYYDTPAGALPASAWHHVQLTYDGAGTVKIYINGHPQTLTATGTLTGDFGASVAQFQVSARENDPSGDALFDGMRLYSECLTPERVAARARNDGVPSTFAFPGTPADAIQIYHEIASSGLTGSGTALSRFTAFPGLSGGLTGSGTALPRLVYFIPADGGLTASGDAPHAHVLRQFQTYDLIGSGGLTGSGTALPRLVYLTPADGGLTAGGTAKLNRLLVLVSDDLRAALPLSGSLVIGTPHAAPGILASSTRLVSYLPMTGALDIALILPGTLTSDV